MTDKFLNGLFEKFVPTFFIISFISMVIFVVGGICFNIYSSVKGFKSEAEQTAKSYLNEMQVEYGHVSCVRNDTDGDGYISCTYKDKKRDKIISIECAYLVNEGCRLPKAVGQSLQNTL